MKKMIISICCFTGMLLQAQLLTPLKVSLRLFADRNLYISGETMEFTAIDMAESPNPDKVLYVELISPNGNKITGAKIEFTDGKSSGCLAIPKDLVSGYYYARAYTKTMRNAGPAYYAYIPVTVFNPVRPELILSENENESRLVIDSTQSDLFAFANLKNRYSTREKADISMTNREPGTTNLKGLCISVVPAGSSAKYMMEINSENGQEQPGYVYYPENEGLTITGELVDKDLNIPIEDKVVTMSVIGIKDFSGYKTDRDGRFFFRLPKEYGRKDVFLSTTESSFQGSQLLIDNDYCTLPVILPSKRFVPNPAEKKLALNMANNYLVSEGFPIYNTRSKTDSVNAAHNTFYAEPTDILRMSDYVQLPTLEEYFLELPFEVKVHKTRAGSTFRFFQPGGNMLVNAPLILVDWVVINDPNKVLTIHPQKIDRIETVNRPYVKGNLTYGGIISIISKEGDFAGIDLPSTGIFINYDFYKPACEACCMFTGVKNKPDARNTLYWQPEVNISEDRVNAISFDTPDTPGRYEIIVQGAYPDGRYYCQSVAFEVR